MTERDLLTIQLHKIHGTKTKNELMDKMQIWSTSRISDGHVTFDEAQDSELLSACVHATKEGMK